MLACTKSNFVRISQQIFKRNHFNLVIRGPDGFIHEKNAKKFVTLPLYSERPLKFAASPYPCIYHQVLVVKDYADTVVKDYADTVVNVDLYV